MAADVLHALLVDASADNLDSPVAEAAASITETVVQRLEDLVLGEREPGAELPSWVETRLREAVGEAITASGAVSRETRG